MLDTMQDIEECFGTLHAAIKKSELTKQFGQRAVNEALKQGLIAQSRNKCSSYEPVCWLTEKGKKYASKQPFFEHHAM